MAHFLGTLTSFSASPSLHTNTSFLYSLLRHPGHNITAESPSPGPGISVEEVVNDTSGTIKDVKDITDISEGTLKYVEEKIKSKRRKNLSKTSSKTSYPEVVRGPAGQVLHTNTEIFWRQVMAIHGDLEANNLQPGEGLFS